MPTNRKSTAEQRASLASSVLGRDSVFRRRNSEDDTNFQEKLWRWSYLKEQFRGNPLNELFKLYTQRIQHGYFSLFLILMFLISMSHFLVVLFESLKVEEMNAVILDLILYAAVGLLSLIGLLLSEKCMSRRTRTLNNTSVISEKYNLVHRQMLKKASLVTFLVLFLVDILVPIYHFLMTMDDEIDTRQYRPAYTTYHIIACYIFLNVSTNLFAIILGVFVSAVHVVILIFITYAHLRTGQYANGDFAYRIVSHVMYLICINGLGLYFRVMTEIMKRRSFLDRRRCVESTLKLKYEKEQEEQLMSSIIPEHIIENVRADVREQINQMEKNQKLPKKNPFENKFIETFDNVTILYADIKNYTHLTTTLKSIKLVETLNELFSRFDDASEDLRVMRIKFLGDCYYCVAGLPPNRISNHADACVELGLKMIKIIRNIREKYHLDIDMRIGIHTGRVSSGIIGETKWQYDIWSDDAYIANKMETTGVPGKVHITHQTKNQLINTYNIEPTDIGQTNELLIRHKLQTYLVTPESEPEKSYLETIGELNTEAERVKTRTSKTYKILSGRRPTEENNRPRNSIYVPRTQLNGVMNHQAKRSEYKRRTAFMEHILKYHERLKNTDTHMKQAIETMPLSKYDQWFRVDEIHPLWLVFRNYNMEKEFVKQPDPLFKYYILSEIIILTCLIIIQNVPIPRFYAWLGYMLLALITAILIPISWTHYLWHGLKYEADKPKPSVINFLYNASQVITQSVALRTFIFLLLSGLFGATVLTALAECENFDVNNRTYLETHNFGIFAILFRSTLDNDSEDTCVLPWHMTETCALAIIMSFLFLRIHILLKLIFAVLVTTIYSYFLWNTENFMASETYNPNMDARIAHILSIVYLTFTLHFIDRQMDYLNRLDYKWNIQLTTEEEEAREMHMLNNMLLNNILPTHVADYYLNTSRKSGPYYEEYTEESPVAVMFASLIDFLAITENNSLTVMNSIISNFDQLLLAKYEDIEKIKVANWTYMVACGLDQGRTTVANEEHSSTERKKHVVINILKFAVDMMAMLQVVNRGTLQHCKLRIGISHGEVTAGVVGSKKPLYDIWGDAVNMASRMDSTGKKGKIQVTKNTADIIMEHGFSCTFRGNRVVKGKDSLVPTFFVDLDEEGQLIRREKKNICVTDRRRQRFLGRRFPKKLKIKGKKKTFSIVSKTHRERKNRLNKIP